MQSNDSIRATRVPLLKRLYLLLRGADTLQWMSINRRYLICESRCRLCEETEKYIENRYYHRSYAIKCGYLSDITQMARDIGFDCPVAITRDAYLRFVVDHGASTPEAHFRKLDELLTAVLKARQEAPEPNVLIVPFWGRTTTGGYMASEVRVVFAHDDRGNNCITIELPNPPELSGFVDACD